MFKLKSNTNDTKFLIFFSYIFKQNVIQNINVTTLDQKLNTLEFAVTLVTVALCEKITLNHIVLLW